MTIEVPVPWIQMMFSPGPQYQAAPEVSLALTI